MKIAKFTFLATAALAISAFSACNTDSDPTPVEPVSDKLGFFVLNKESANSSSLGFFQVNNLTYHATFGNSQSLLNGAGKDMIRYGNKLYISFEGGSGKVVVLDALTGNGIQTLSVNDARYLVGYKGKVYVSHGDRYVSQIDTTTFSVNSMEVGNTPEQLTAFGNKLYIANSGAHQDDYDNKIAVVNTTSFALENSIAIPGAVNLDKIAADSVNKTLYVNASATYDGDTKLTDSKLYTFSVDNGNINSNIPYGLDFVQAAYAFNTSTGASVPFLFATSSNKSGGATEYLCLTNLPNFVANNTYFQSTNEIKTVTGFKYIPELFCVVIGSKESGATNGAAFIYTWNPGYSNATLFAKFESFNPIAFVASY
ncbi:YncE family protein [Olivibacter sitiensis]|uniref:YncE family protein n=1 Tax=Olivibacter sitiensis TaxID=376470 RepID=UPI00040CAABC|nr:hypothetical protein [Olivibacter sitiensis]